MLTRLLMVLALLVALAGCSGLQMDTPNKSFEAENRDFLQRLRWKDIPGAAKHVSKPRRKAFRDHFGGQDDLNIADVRLESADFTKDGEEVESVVVVEYYRLPSTRVQTHRYEVRWTFFDQDQPTPVGWQITSDIPPLP